MRLEPAYETGIAIGAEDSPDGSGLFGLVFMVGVEGLANLGLSSANAAALTLEFPDPIPLRTIDAVDAE